MTSTTVGANNQGVINAPNKSLGIIQMDMEITSTLATDLNIEMFNPASSDLIIANSGLHTYQPLAGNPDTVFATGTTHEYGFGNVQGCFATYINAAAVTPPAGTATPDTVYWDAMGNKVYRPGYATTGSVDGNVTISVSLNNATFRQFHDWCDQCCNVWDWYSWKTEYSELSQQVSTLEFRRKNILGKTKSESVVPKTAKSEDQYNPLLLTVAINQRMTRQDGVQYVVKAAKQNDSTQTVQSSLFIQPLTFSASTGRFVVNKNF